MTAKAMHDKRASSPNAKMRMSLKARAHMRTTERVVLRYYNDMGKKKGNCTWGPGLLAHRGICNEEELARKVTLQQVDLEYDRRVAEAEGFIKRYVDVGLSQDQFDGLVSFTYNVGVGQASGAYDYINRHDFAGAAKYISRMTGVTVRQAGKKKIVLAHGLILQRSEEAAPFRNTVQRAN